MMTESRNNFASLKLTDAIILAIITALGYLLSYSYEAGFLSFYGLESKFVELPLVTIISSSFGSFSVFCMLLYFANYLFQFFENKSNIKNIIKTTKEVILFLSLIFLLLVCLSKLGIIWDSLLFIFSIIELIFAILFLFIMQFNNSSNSKKNRDIIVLAILITSSIYSFSFSLGEKYAETKKDYYVIDSMPNHVVISTYEDKFIIVPIDAEKKVFTRQYMLISKENLVFKKKEIGPIAPEKTSE